MNRTEIVELFRHRATALTRGRAIVTLHQDAGDVVVLHYGDDGEVREARLSIEALRAEDWLARVETQLWPTRPIQDAHPADETLRVLQPA